MCVCGNKSAWKQVSSKRMLVGQELSGQMRHGSLPSNNKSSCLLDQKRTDGLDPKIYLITCLITEDMCILGGGRNRLSVFM